jgi:tetratricopeptide (TPR) repeat protein
VRPVVVLVSLALALPAQARLVPGEEPGEPHRPSFWARVKSPHIVEITRLTREASLLRYQVANQYYEAHTQPIRRQVLRDALARYERAAALDPDRPELRLEAGHTAFEALEWERALGHYRAYRERSEVDRLVVDYDLGECLVRLGRFTEAVEHLEGLVDRIDGLERGRYLELYGYALMALGRLDDAVDALERGVELTSPQMQWGGFYDLVGLAILAVAYDRDEQLGRAHDALDQLRAIDPQFYFLVQALPPPASSLPSQRLGVPFSPPADEHYFLGLVFEAQGRYAEAAAEWRSYLDSMTPTYAARAREHLRQADHALAEAARAPRRSQSP